VTLRIESNLSSPNTKAPRSIFKRWPRFGQFFSVFFPTSFSVGTSPVAPFRSRLPTFPPVGLVSQDHPSRRSPCVDVVSHPEFFFLSDFFKPYVRNSSTFTLRVAPDQQVSLHSNRPPHAFFKDGSPRVRSWDF